MAIKQVHVWMFLYILQLFDYFCSPKNLLAKQTFPEGGLGGLGGLGGRENMEIHTQHTTHNIHSGKDNFCQSTFSTEGMKGRGRRRKDGGWRLEARVQILN